VPEVPLQDHQHARLLDRVAQNTERLVYRTGGSIFSEIEG
jgi:hypothetical protein